MFEEKTRESSRKLLKLPSHTFAVRLNTKPIAVISRETIYKPKMLMSLRSGLWRYDLLILGDMRLV